MLGICIWFNFTKFLLFIYIPKFNCIVYFFFHWVPYADVLWLENKCQIESLLINAVCVHQRTFQSFLSKMLSKDMDVACTTNGVCRQGKSKCACNIFRISFFVFSKQNTVYSKNEILACYFNKFEKNFFDSWTLSSLYLRYNIILHLNIRSKTMDIHGCFWRIVKPWNGTRYSFPYFD
jgi:hypothetical protein